MDREAMKIDAARIKALRETHSWSQEHLASAAGLSTRTVQRLEAEGRGSHESCMAVAAALGVLPADLLLTETPASLPASFASGQVEQFLGIPSNVFLALVIAVMAMAYGGYNIGKDMAIRDNARCHAQPGLCNR